MSEYLSKKAVLDHIDGVIGLYGGDVVLQTIRDKIQSSAFDADNSENQRLRAALEQALRQWKSYADEHRGGWKAYIADSKDKEDLEAQEFQRISALLKGDTFSTTTEPTGVDRLIGDLIDERCPKCGANMLGNKVGDKWCSMVGCDYSINAAEGDGNDA